MCFSFFSLLTRLELHSSTSNDFHISMMCSRCRISDENLIIPSTYFCWHWTDFPVRNVFSPLPCYALCKKIRVKRSDTVWLHMSSVAVQHTHISRWRIQNISNSRRASQLGWWTSTALSKLYCEEQKKNQKINCFPMSMLDNTKRDELKMNDLLIGNAWHKRLQREEGKIEK